MATTTSTTTTTTEAPAATANPFYTTYSGTGSKIVSLGMAPNDAWYILHLTTKAVAEVKVFDSSGEETYFPGNEFSLRSQVKSYDGCVLGKPEIAKFQINTKGAWTLAVEPLDAATSLVAGATAKGTFDDVIALSGSPSSLNISGDPNDVFGNFIVEYFQQGDSFGNGLVNELGKYEGVAVVAGDGWVTVQAQFPWTISAEK